MPTGFDPRHMEATGLRRYMGKNRLFPFLNLRSPISTVVWDDDFLGDTLHGGYGSKTNGSGAEITGIVANTVNGICRLTTGTADDGYAGIPLGETNFQGDLNPVLLARVRANSAVTTLKIEVGWTDSEGDAGAVNSLATPSFTATDCAVWCVDTDDTAYWQATSAGSSLTPSPTKIEPGSNATLTADQWDWFAVAIETNTASFWYKSGSKGWVDAGSITTAIEGGNNILPWVFAQARAGAASRTVDIDRIIAWQDRE
jgi:hypothetical protein